MTYTTDLATGVLALATRLIVVPGRSDVPPQGITLRRPVAFDVAGDLRPGDLLVVVGRDNAQQIDDQLGWFLRRKADRPFLVLHTMPADEQLPDLTEVLQRHGIVIDRSAADPDTGVQVLSGHRSALEPDDAQGAAEMRSRAALAGENARLRRALRSAEGRVTSLERKVDRIESSGVLLVGRTVVDAVRHPKRARGNVKQIYSRWRRTGGRSATSKPTSSAPAREIVSDGADILLAHRAFVPVPRQLPTIALIGSPAIERLLRPHAHVVSLLPHEAEAMLERVLPDLLLIDSRAAAPGGAWAFIGTPSAPDRDAAVIRAQAAAGAIGVPVVLWRSTGPEHTAFLQPIVDRADLVLDLHAGAQATRLWTPGVSFANVTAARDNAGERSGLLVPHLDGAADRGQLARARVLAEGGNEVSLVPGAWGQEPSASTGWLSRVTALQSCAVGVPAATGEAGGPSLEVLELLSSGLRLLGPDIAGAPADIVTDDTGAPALTADERLTVRRWAFAEHSVPVGLDRLMRDLGAESDPLWSRRQTVTAADVTADVTAEAVEALADDLLKQTWAPHELVVPSARALGPVRDRLRDAGIEVRGAGSDNPVALAAAGACDATVPWSLNERWGPHHLADAALRHEATAPTGRLVP